jgi:hypothetical protein
MNMPFRSPREADVIYEQAVAFRWLAPTERLNQGSEASGTMKGN